MGPDDLVLCSGTLPRGTGFAERLAAASGAGFTSVSLWGATIPPPGLRVTATPTSGPCSPITG